jgi:hypothetical protein
MDSPSSLLLANSLTQVGGAPSSQDDAQHSGYPLGIEQFLDGTHHTDELCVRFEAGWKELRAWLAVLADVSAQVADEGERDGGDDDDDEEETELEKERRLGRVRIIYR